MAVTIRLGRVPAMVWSVGFLAGLYGWLLFDVLFLGRTFVGGDLSRHHFPLLSLVRPLWELEGGLPLWNPLVAAGQPWAANPEQAAFHPLTALFLVLPAGPAFSLQVLLPVAAAVAGGLFFGRALDLSRTAAILLAVTWGFGGVLLSSTQYFPTLFAAAALPWVLGFAARIGGGSGRSDIAGLALSEGLLCAAGEPTQILLSAPIALVAAWHFSAFRKLPGVLVRSGPRPAAPPARDDAERKWLVADRWPRSAGNKQTSEGGHFPTSVEGPGTGRGGGLATPARSRAVRRERAVPRSSSRGSLSASSSPRRPSCLGSCTRG